MMRTCAILLMALATPAWGCVCTGNWPSVKQAWENAPFVFLGTVEIADPDGDPRQTVFQEQSVRIRVDEAFKGVVMGQTIELHEGGNDCAAKFRTGQRAVFYLYKEAANGHLYVPACSHSLGNAAPEGDDLLFLRKLPRSAHGTRLSGEIKLYEDSPKQETRGLSGVRIKISGPKGSTNEAVTNSDGAYELYNLPPGRYSASIAVPRGLKIDFPNIAGSVRVPGNNAAVVLTANGGASVNFSLQADTRLTGRTLDGKGNPVSICLHLEPLAEPIGEEVKFACSKEGGVFEMTMIPPGQYRLVARDEVKIDDVTSKSTLYYPGTRDRRQAAIVSIEAGEYINHLDVRVPSDEKRYRIAGRMQFQDGAPIKYGAVTFVSAQSAYTETTQIGANGAFGLSALANMEGELRGEAVIMAPLLKACPEFQVTARVGGMLRFMAASPIQLSTDSDRENIKLILPFPSCKAF